MITAKYVPESPFNAMQILSNEFLCWRVLTHVLIEKQNIIRYSTDIFTHLPNSLKDEKDQDPCKSKQNYTGP